MRMINRYSCRRLVGGSWRQHDAQRDDRFPV
jgi:hypothetical protein